MKVLLTNDDGIESPGLEALARAAQELGEVIVVAPDRSWSYCGHRLTVGEAIRMEVRGEGRIALTGTPADCVRLGLERLGGGPDVVISGINIGGNLGVDVFHSGTVAAAREAALHGVPAIAISHHIRPGMELRWGDAAAWLGPVLRELVAEPLANGAYWNVNIPHRPADAGAPRAIRCALDTSPMPVKYEETPEGFRYRGNYHERTRLPGRDIDVCFGGNISVTLLGPVPAGSHHV